VNHNLSFIIAVVIAACGGSPRSVSTEAPSPARGISPVPSEPTRTRSPQRLLAIDWTRVTLASDGDALALWDEIAPTGADWQERLDEVPARHARALALALLRAGNFACAPAQPAACGRPALDLPEPAPAATLADPCMRRVLALWSLAQLEVDDVPGVLDVLRSIVQLPPPEHELASAALEAVAESDHARRLELIGLAWRAGHRDPVVRVLGELDAAHLARAATTHHVDAALDLMSPAAHRAVFLAAITDEAMAGSTRAQAISELAATDDTLAADVRAALVKATTANDCMAAAAAARALAQHGDRRYLPARARTVEASMRALCVVASHELLQRSDEPSLLVRFVPPHGLERIEVAYDPLGEVDDDGDGDPRTRQTAELVPRAALVVPEAEDLVRAMRHCQGTTCTSDDREFRFSWRRAGGQLVLYRLVIAERPPCAAP
jgi:hypothetical protein